MAAPEDQQTLKQPWRRGLFAAISLAALVLILWGSSVARTNAVLPRDADADHIARDVEIEGFRADSGWQLAWLVLRYMDPGDALPPPHDTVILLPEVDLAAFLVVLVGCLLYWAVAAFAFAPRAERSAVRDIYLCFLCTGVAAAIGGVAPPRAPGQVVLPILYPILISFMPVLFVRFSLTFPRRMPIVERHRFLFLPLFLVAGGVAAWNIAAWLGWFRAEGVEGLAATALPIKVMDALLVTGIALGIVCLYRNGRGAALAREKRQAKWILWGIAIGATPFVFLRVLPRLLFGYASPVPPSVDQIVEMAVPVAFLIAVVRDRFYDIDLVIRRSLLYTALALGAAGLFAVLLFVLGHLVGERLGLPRPGTTAASAALAAACFVALRRVAERWVDRTFFRIQYRGRQDLEVLRGELATATTKEGVAGVLQAFLARVLAPTTAGVVTGVAPELAAAGRLDGDLLRAAPDLWNGHAPDTAAVQARPGATEMPEVEMEGLPPALLEAGVHVVQPVARDGRLFGLLLLGEKESGRRYLEEDLRLLSASSLQAARSLERMTLVQQVVKESMAKQALEDLAEQKAEFFARVAHDLRTPLTAIHWSLQNLQEGLAGPLNEKQGEYIASVSAAERQLGRLVANLVELSRLDLAPAQHAAGPVDLRTIIAEATTALRPIAEVQEVRLAELVPESAARASGRPEAASQIVMNLLDNALKYAPKESTVEIELREVDDHLVLSVRDRGPGLPEGECEQLFELFTQGPESPHRSSKGFGIGLHIVRTWTASMGGVVEAHNRSGGGAEFTCSLPIWREGGEEA